MTLRSMSVRSCLEHVVGETPRRKDRGMTLDLVVRDAPHRIEAGGIQVVDRVDGLLVQETQRVFRLQQFLQPVHVIMGDVFGISAGIGRYLHLVQVLQTVQRLLGGQPRAGRSWAFCKPSGRTGSAASHACDAVHLQNIDGQSLGVGQHAVGRRRSSIFPLSSVHPSIGTMSRPERSRLV